MTSDQPERFQQIHNLQTFQDGRAPSIKTVEQCDHLGKLDLKEA